MVPTLAAVLPLVPVAVGAIALGRALFESARDGRVGDAAIATASLSGLALFLLSLQPARDPRTHVLVAAVAGTIWLGGRARRHARWAPALLVAAGTLAGARPIVGLGLSPFVLVELARGLRGPAPMTATLRALFVFVGALVVGHFALGGVAFLPGRWTTWVADASHAFGAAGVALGVGGLLFTLLDEPGRRTLALSATLLLGGEIAVGAAGPLSALTLALGVGLVLLAAGRHVADGPRGASLALAPLVLLALAEPLTARVEATRWSAWTLGPVPPRDAAPRSRAFEAPPRR